MAEEIAAGDGGTQAAAQTGLSTGAQALDGGIPTGGTAAFAGSTPDTLPTAAWLEGDTWTSEDRGFVQNKAWKGPQDVVGAYRKLESHLGAGADRLITLPAEGADPSEMRAVWERLGAPKEASGYKFADVPEGVELNQGLRDGFAKFALEESIPAPIIEKIEAWHNQQLLAGGQAQQDEIARQADADLAELRTKWGPAYDERLALGQRAAEVFGVDVDQMTKIEAAIGTAGIMEMFSNIGQKIGSPEFVTGDSGGGDGRQFGKTASQIKSDMADLRTKLGGDRSAHATYNEGKGEDFARMKTLKSQLAQVAPGKEL